MRRNSRIFVSFLVCLCSLLIVQFQLDNKVLAANPSSFGIIVGDRIEFKSDASDQAMTVGFLYENDEFRVESAQHNQYLEVTIINSRDVSMLGMRGYVAREFTAW